MKKLILLCLGLLLLANCSGQPLAEEKKAAKDQGTQAVAAQDADGNDIDSSQAPPPPSGSPTAASPAGPSSDDINKGLYQKFIDARKRRDVGTANQVGGEILSRNPNDTRILNSLAALAIEQEKYDLARLYIDKTLVKDPNNGAAYNNLGVVELKTDNLRLALIQFKKATAFDPKNKAAHANLGAIYLKYRNYTNAAEELKDAVENGDQSPETLSNYAFALTGINDYNGAAKTYERALAKDSNNITILVNYSALMVERLHNYKDALKVLNKIRFIAREPAILDKVEILLKKAEKPGSEKGVSDVKICLPKIALFLFALVSFLVWNANYALAQTTPPPAAPKAPAASKGTKRTTVDFEDQLVQGEVKKPELFYLLQKKQFNFGKLIKLRENFIPEMDKTSEDIEKAK